VSPPPREERQGLAALADHGQPLPVVVVAADAPCVLVDGYKRVRALQRLPHDMMTTYEPERGRAAS
jgi:hypothetical protein